MEIINVVVKFSFGYARLVNSKFITLPKKRISLNEIIAFVLIYDHEPKRKSDEHEQCHKSNQTLTSNKNVEQSLETY